MILNVLFLAVLLCIPANLLAKEKKGTIVGRIFGGTAVKGTDSPWMASVGQRAEYLCGGAILNKRTILTAAQCLYGRTAKRLIVRVGSRYVFKGGRVFSVAEFRYHPAFDNKTVEADIGLIRLTMGIYPSPYAQPVMLPSSDYIPPVGASVIISGWGETEHGAPDLLQYAVLKIIDDKICRQFFKEEVNVSSMICAGRLDAPINTCIGDSGSPLVIDKMAIGVLSWGSVNACGKINEMSVFTRVPVFVKWIKDYVGGFGEQL